MHVTDEDGKRRRVMVPVKEVALRSCVGIDLSRQVMTKSQMSNVMSVVKKPRS